MGRIGLAALLFVVLADWSSAWICGHPVMCGDHDDHETAAHAHSHDHGPFEHSHDRDAGRVEHAQELLGICGSSSSRDAELLLSASKRIDLTADYGRLEPPIFGFAAGGGLAPTAIPERHTSSRATLLMTERWLS
jgi:hypothetical protein